MQHIRIWYMSHMHNSLAGASRGNRYCLWPCSWARAQYIGSESWAITSTGRVGLWFFGFYVQEHPKAQPAVALILKRLRKRGQGFMSHPTDWEMPGSNFGRSIPLNIDGAAFYTLNLYSWDMIYVRILPKLFPGSYSN